MYLREIVATWDGGADALSVLNALPRLRHAAVHRVPISPAKMEEFFALAERGASVLGDNNAHLTIWRLSALFEWKIIIEQKERETWAGRMEKRLKHLELVKAEIEKEELQWEAVAPKLNSWIELPGRGEPELAAFQAEVDSILVPGDGGKVDESQKKEDDLPMREYSRVFNGFPRWEIGNVVGWRMPHTYGG